MNKRLRGKISLRPLHFIFITDCSASMGHGGKIQALNQAIRGAIPAIKKEADENPNAQVFLRAVKFSQGAQWHIATPTPVNQFKWIDLEVDNSAVDSTDMGAAFLLVADQLKIPPMPERALPPVLVLISDGQPTDDYKKGLDALNSLPWGKKAIRLAIAIGKDANRDVLKEFIGNPEIEPLQANNPEALVQYVKLVSTTAVSIASSPASQQKQSPGNSGTSGVGKQVNIRLTNASRQKNSSANDVW